MSHFVHYVGDHKDYGFDWSEWLEAGDSIASQEVEVSGDEGLAVTLVNRVGSQVNIWLQGGTAGSEVTVTCRITTEQGRSPVRAASLVVRSAL